MLQVKIVAILLCIGQMILGCSIVWSAPPLWKGGNSQAAANIGHSEKPASKFFKLQCPRAYSGIKGELLPTYWEPADKGQAAELIKSQVQGQYFYCVYRIPGSGRDIHASVRRLLPKGYNCISDGEGTGECRANP